MFRTRCVECAHEELTEHPTCKCGCHRQRLEEGKPPAEPILQFFDYKHLPDFLQAASVHFHELAHRVVAELPRNPERTVALRKLLEAKDAAVRSILFKADR